VHDNQRKESGMNKNRFGNEGFFMGMIDKMHWMDLNLKSK
jgi:hypothetical protein